MGNVQGRRMSPLDRLLLCVIHFIDSTFLWHRLPVFLGLSYLVTRRHLHNKYNLIPVGDSGAGVSFDPARYSFRTADGRYNDPSNALAGSQGTFFGRNMLPAPQDGKIMSPDPVLVAAKLLARKKMIDTGKQFNLIAASWVQFMIYDWVDHLEDTEQVEISTPASIEGECPLKSFRFNKTKQVPTGSTQISSGHININTSWDGSSIYGSNAERLEKVRTYKDGKLRIAENGHLLHDEDGTLISGDFRNIWAGVSLLGTLFVKEHNTVCDLLKKSYPDLTDEELYRYARLVISAVIAKVHTIDWSVELLKTDILLAGLRMNWYGLLGKTFKERFGHLGSSLLSGYVGSSKAENHGVSYALTEEFVSVYRMHQLLPDKLLRRDISSAPRQNKTPPILREVPMEELIGLQGEKRSEEIGFEAQMVSMGHQACGALELQNFPLWMTNLIPQDADGKTRPDRVNLPALEIYRDRERSVARYNQFRRNMMMKPIASWEDLTEDKETISILREVYEDDIERLDLLVGLMAEKKIKGFIISETTFFNFLFHAPRRLEADRFFTSNFNEETYTKEGLKWVNSTESLKDVLDRHYPELVRNWMNSTSAFSVWDSAPSKESRIPLYLRLP
ncbi:alpha-dioxygenase PIOX-like isoform X2 [Aristolochia californica]|uniref:alpha-dioxygenase PIOX-like isoform X2 n=1 Tax=Aristolochia californica TaxID=171875 RepID=UPI0035DE6FEB